MADKRAYSREVGREAAKRGGSKAKGTKAVDQKARRAAARKK